MNVKAKVYPAVAATRLSTADADRLDFLVAMEKRGASQILRDALRKYAAERIPALAADQMEPA